MIRTTKTVIALLAFLTAARMARAAEDSPTLSCTRTTTVATDGTIHMHTVCVLSAR